MSAEELSAKSSIMKYAKTELQQAVGPLQLCAGFVSGCEAGFHAMKAIFDKDECEGMIFVDASNAFNQLNREATIINCQSFCPALAPVLITTYRLPPSLYVDGECIKSFKEPHKESPLDNVCHWNIPSDQKSLWVSRASLVC